jgi:hypothetical protein
MLQTFPSARMMSVISELPAIHATLVGLIGGVAAAYLVYAMQRIYEMEDKFNAAVETARALATPTLVVHVGKIDPKIMAADYETTCRWMMRASLLNPARASAQEIGEAVKSLYACLYFTLVNYPFSGVPSSADKEWVVPLEDENYNQARFLEMRKLLSTINFHWARNSENILRLAEVYTEICRTERVEARKELDAAFEENLRRHEVPADKISDQKAPIVIVSWADSIFGLFEQYRRLATEAFPELEDSWRNLKLQSKRFGVVSNIRIVAVLVAFEIAIGIVVPLIIDRLHEGGVAISKSIDFSLLAITFVPYLVGCIWLLIGASRLERRGHE